MNCCRITVLPACSGSHGIVSRRRHLPQPGQLLVVPYANAAIRDLQSDANGGSYGVDLVLWHAARRHSSIMGMRTNMEHV